MERITISGSGFSADANVQPRHAADAAAWVWHPACARGETAFLRFSLDFHLAADAAGVVHVTADQRFQLQLDGVEVGQGPDRCTVEQWTVASYPLNLTAGDHRLTALVWWLDDETLAELRADPAFSEPTLHLRPPVAQSSWRGGFLFAGDAAHAAKLNTGRAPWQVENLTGAVKTVQPIFYAYHDIGPEFHIDGTVWQAPVASVPAVVIAGVIAGNVHGVQRPGWRLQPASLPEQERKPMQSGRLRALSSNWREGPVAGEIASLATAERWSSVLTEGNSIVIPARSEQTVLWDFEDYVCGYARLVTAGGAGARVRIEWAEALHEASARSQINAQTPKGHRDEIQGKLFFGFGDEFMAADGVVPFPAWWWRAGRYLQIRIRTGAEALMIQSLKLVSTGYPLGEAARFACDDEELTHLLTRCARTLRACAHEVWTDCPYYEQMAYVGDARLAGLSNYALYRDDRLSRRMLELFDDSRRDHGLVTERAPASWQQVSVTYSLLWVLMVRDFTWWRDDLDFVRARLRGVRAMLEEVHGLLQDGLLRRTPGWSFVDWVPEWTQGCGPGVREGDSSIVNLHLLLAWRTQAELEQVCGEPELAALAGRRAARLEEAITARYWCPSHELLADTGERQNFSEHAQALGLLSGLVAPGGAARWVSTWLAAAGLTRPTVYFSFYILEALQKTGQADELHRRIDAWKGTAATGLLTMPEAPEPTRSDCHGWSAHWRWHATASVAGVRPLGPRFERVEVKPLFGALTVLEVEVWHPRGTIKVSLRREAGKLTGDIDLPAGTVGELHWQSLVHLLQPGHNPVQLG